MKAMWQQGHHEVFYVVLHCKKTFYGIVPSFLLEACPCCTLEEPGLEQGYGRLVACSGAMGPSSVHPPLGHLISTAALHQNPGGVLYPQTNSGDVGHPICSHGRLLPRRTCHFGWS